MSNVPGLATSGGHSPLTRFVQVLMLGLALLLPVLTWPQAAGCALLALLFSLFILPRLDTGFGVRESGFGIRPTDRVVH